MTDAPEPEPPAEAFSSAPVAAQARSEGPRNVETVIDEVNRVIDNLKTALDDMEEVLEMIETLERQQNLDEREIESLRRALRQTQRPRDHGHHPHR